MKKASMILIVFVTLTGVSFSQSIENDNLLITHGPWIQNLANSGVTVLWMTNKPAVPGITLTLPVCWGSGP